MNAQSKTPKHSNGFVAYCMSISDVLSKLSSSCQMAAGTGLYCHWDSIAAISAGVPSQSLKHCGHFNWDTLHTCHMSACMSHMCHTGVIASTTSTVSLKDRSIMGHRLNHCAFLRLVQLRGWGNCPVCDSGRSPTVNGSLILGDSPSAPALVSTGIQWMASLGEAYQCSGMTPRLCFSLWCNPLQFCLPPPPSLDERQGR